MSGGDLGPCSMGVGCDEAGVCYAAAHGQPEMCPRELAATNAHLIAVLEDLMAFDGARGTYDASKAYDAKQAAEAALREARGEPA